MLSRLALRAIQSPVPSHLRHASPIIPATISLQTRLYASSNRLPRPPPPPSTSPAKPARRPPPPAPRANDFQRPSRSPRQTSPGTSLPKDETWTPQDGIKFAGAGAAATAGEAGRGEGADLAQEMRQDSTPARQPDSGFEPDAAQSEKPLAQEVNVDQPEEGQLRHATQEAQAEAENISPEAQGAAEAASTPQQPLPDLRQGIPSTFNIEFGAQQSRSSEQQQQTAQDQLDLTYEQETHQQRDRGERDYDSSAYETSLDRRRALFANYMYAGILLLAVGGSVYLSRPFSTREEVPTNLLPEDATGWSPKKMYARVRARCGDQLGYYTEPSFTKLLPEVPESQRQPFTLVLSLNDLMIHTEWDREHGYRTAKRPGIDYFIRYLSQYYELVLFTSASIAMADPVIKKLDPYHFIMWPLGREATKFEGGEYVKDLAYLNRDLKKTLIIDTHAPHVKNQPENAIIIPPWKGDAKDPHVKDLVALIPFLEYVATMGVEDVREVLKSFEGSEIAVEFARREAEARKRFNADLEAAKDRRPKRSLGSLASSLGVKNSPQMGGGMVLADGQSVSEGLAQGKMLSDQIREQGQRQYEYLEAQIREHGAQWLKEEEEEQKRLMEAQMKDMKKSTLSWFGGRPKEE